MESITVEVGEIGLPSIRETLSDLHQRSVSMMASAAAKIASLWFRTAFSAVIYSVIIGSVAIYDIYLTVRYAASLAQMEVNPLGRWLMNLQEADIYFLEELPNVTPFLVLKALGTMVVIATIQGFLRWRSDMGHAIAIGVSCFQIGLAGYLTFR